MYGIMNSRGYIISRHRILGAALARARRLITATGRPGSLAIVWVLG